MAQPLMPQSQEDQKPRPPPRKVVAVKGVDLVLVTYTDEAGQQITQLAVVGDNQVHLLEGRALGFARTTTPQGVANPWLRDGIFEKLGRKAK